MYSYLGALFPQRSKIFSRLSDSLDNVVYEIERNILVFNHSSSSRRSATILTARWRQKNGESIILARRERKWNVSFQTGPRLDATSLHRCLQWRRKNFRILAQESFVGPAFHFCNIKHRYLAVSLPLTIIAMR